MAYHKDMFVGNVSIFKGYIKVADTLKLTVFYAVFFLN